MKYSSGISDSSITSTAPADCDTLIGLTTTALYGIHSMYNGIPLWKTLGESTIIFVIHENYNFSPVRI